MSDNLKLIEANNYVALQNLSPEPKKLIEFLIENSEKNKFAIELLSKYFPFTKKQLEEYKVFLDWREVGSNENLSWNYDLIYHFKNEFFGNNDWNGDTLCYSNKAVNFTTEVISLINDSSWNFKNYSLSNNESLHWTLEMIKAGEKVWGWENLSMSHNLPWSIELLERFSKKWIWGELSNNPSLPWSSELIDRFSDRWNWQILAHNSGLPCTIKLFEKFYERKNKVEWFRIHYNNHIPWSKEIIEHFQDRWVWSSLSRNSGLPLTFELIDEYSNKWDWDSINKNKGIYFEIELIEIYKTKPWITEHGIPVHPEHPKLIDLIKNYRPYINLIFFASETNFQFSIKEIENLKEIKGFITGLSSNPNFLWSIETINSFIDFWNWENLSSNTGIDLSIELIEMFQDYWVWESLSYNKSLPWSTVLIKKFGNKLKLPNLIEYPNIIWSEEFILNLHGLAYTDYRNSDFFGYEGGFTRYFWEALNCSTKIPWSKAILKNFMMELDWSGLSSNGYIVSPLELLEEFRENWDWTRLSSNENLPWSEELIEKYENHWDWSNLSHNEKISWSDDLIEKYKNKWDWENLSGNNGLPWSEELIEKYQNKWSVLNGLGEEFDQTWVDILTDAYNKNKSWPALVPREVFYRLIYSNAGINDEAIRQIFNAIKLKKT